MRGAEGSPGLLWAVVLSALLLILAGSVAAIPAAPPQPSFAPLLPSPTVQATAGRSPAPFEPGGSGPSPDAQTAANNLSAICASCVVSVVSLPSVTGFVYDVAFDRANGYVYASFLPAPSISSDSYVAVIDTRTNTIIGNITVGVQPMGVAVDDSNGYVYVANSASSNVTVINGATDRVVGSVPVGAGPQDVRSDPANGYVYVAGGGTVSAILGTTIVARFSLGACCLAIDTAKNAVYASTAGNNTVWVLNATTLAIVGSVGVGTNPSGLAYDGSNGKIYVANTGSYNVTVINGTTRLVVGSIPFPSGPAPNYYDDGEFDPLNGLVIVADMAADEFALIDPATNKLVGVASYDNATCGCGKLQGWGATIDPLNGYLYTSANNKVEALNITAPVPRGTGPTAAPNPDEAGARMTFAVNVTTPGKGTVNYSWSKLPCRSQNASTIACTIPVTFNGSYSSAVVVAFSSGWELTGSVNYTVIPALRAALRPSHTGDDVNETLQFQTRVAGGQSPYSYRYSSSNPAAGCAPSASFALNCTPTSNITFTASVNVTDAMGISFVATSPMISVAPALRATFAVSNATPLLSQTIAILTNTTGGRGPYSYAYTGLPPGCVSVNVSAIGCLPTQAGYYNATVNVTDINRGMASATVKIHVVFDFNVVVVSNTSVGSPFTIRVNMASTNSTASVVALSVGYGVLTYAYSGLPPGCQSQDAPSVTCTPTQTGTYSITVSVHDQVGNHNAHTVVVNVLPGPPLVVGLSGVLLLAVIGAVVVAGTLATIVLLRRRKSRKGPGSNE